MSFDTLTFWIFFALAWGLWRFLPFGMAKSAAVLCSFVFYGWWNPWYLILIGLSSITDYVAGARIHGSEDEGTRRRWVLLSLILNLGLLAIFKYGYFIAENAIQIGEWFSMDLRIPADKKLWVVPVGISFYTFQTLSYTLDIFRRRLTPAKSFRDFLLFVSFFPQLVAGPIVRAGELLPQFERRRRLLPVAIQTGLYHIIWGLCMKIVVADNLAVPVDAAFAPTALVTIDGVTSLSLTPAQAWSGVMYFSIQIFADFAGYSAIAIGLAYLMGLRFPANFRYPYIASGLSEFWTRWHISLSQWLRDYLYIPLGGNRAGPLKTMANLMITMLLGGLWHGASWTFVAWGGLHGLGLCVERALRRGRGSTAHHYRTQGRIGLTAALAACIRMAVVFLFLQVTWVFFRAKSFAFAWAYLKKMFGGIWNEPFGIESMHKRVLPLVLLVLILHLGQLLHEWFGLRKSAILRAVVAAVLAFLLLVIRRPDAQSFIYFQF